MASRDLTSTQFRQVTQQVVKNENGILNATADIAANIAKQSQEAKITQGVSQAQLELAELENQYRIDFEGDPSGGIKDYRQNRQEIFDRIQEGISPLYSRQWQEQTRKISARNDAVQQAWALKQSRINTVNSVNSTIKNNFIQAGNDGRAFAQSDESEIEAFVNFGTSLEAIEQFATKNLGEQTSASMLETYEEDYLKSFISGVSESNPHKALSLLETDQVKNGIADVQQYNRFKNSIAARVKRFDAAQKQSQKAQELSGTNSLLQKIGNVGYAELQADLSQFNVSPAAKAFYEQVNGYANSRKALSQEEKTNAKGAFNLFMSDVIGKDNLTNDDISLLQDSIYTGMTKNILSKKEGFTLLNDLINPVLEQQKNRADQFETGEWNPFVENLGLDTLKQEIEVMTGADKFELNKDGEIKDPQNQFLLNKNANIIFDGYLESLSLQAKQRGTSISGLSSLSSDEETAVYNQALNFAKEKFIRINFPSLSNVKDLPTTVVTPKSNVNMTEADIDKMTEAELDKFLAGQ